MKHNHRNLNLLRTAVTAILFNAGVAALGVIGCGPADKREGAATQPIAAGVFAPPARTGAQLWAENCTRCHYARPPTQYSAQQWDIIMTHMRLRADLTGHETREITKFLQASN
jgi:hypothetical protein